MERKTLSYKELQASALTGREVHGVLFGGFWDFETGYSWV